MSVPALRCVHQGHGCLVAAHAFAPRVLCGRKQRAPVAIAASRQHGAAAAPPTRQRAFHLNRATLPQRQHRSPLVATAAAASSVPGDSRSDGADGSDLALAALAQLISSTMEFVRAQFLPVVLLCALAVGYFAPQLGVAAGSQINVPAITCSGIFIIQGLSLRRGETLKALSASGALAWGLLSVLFISPLAALVALQAPLHPPELAVGLAVFCCMPTALSSGVTFTQQVGGNVALALLLTISSNIIAIFTMPFVLRAVLGGALAASAAATGAPPGSLELSPLPLLQQLVRAILVPMLFGASLRAFVPGVAGLVDGHKRQLAYMSAILLSLVPWIQVSKAVGQKVPIEALDVVLVGLMAVALNCTLLLLNATACRLFRLGGSNPDAASPVRSALTFTASVKTLPVAVTVISKLEPLLGSGVGIAVVPCVLAHLAQTLVGSVLASVWAARAGSQRAHGGAGSAKAA